jgi:integrase
MVFRRSKRPGFYFQARYQRRWKQICTRTPDRRLSQKYEAMWNVLAEEHRAWDVLELVVGENSWLKLGDLHDMWLESGRDIHELRRRLQDTDLSALIEPFLDIYERTVAEDSRDHVEHHLRWLMPADAIFPRSRANVDFLTERLYSYPGARNTLRKVHSSWSVFFEHCTNVKALFEWSPMAKVKRPPLEKSAVEFYELDVVERIVGWQPSADRRAMLALLYGTSIDVTTAVHITRNQFLPATKELRAPGTKAHTRDRVVRVADWAWPIVWEHAKDILPNARLWSDTLTRHDVHDWHTEALDDLKIEPRYPPRNARHHWAVRAARAGTPIIVMQIQLGHSSPQLTLATYGRFLPSSADREKWEQAAGDYETKRREAK